MTIRELKQKLNRFPDDLEVLTKNTVPSNGTGVVRTVRKGSYGTLGKEIPCVFITDEQEGAVPASSGSKTCRTCQYRDNMMGDQPCASCGNPHKNYTPQKN